MQGNTTWHMDDIEQMLSPRSQFAANLVQRLAQGVSHLGSVLGGLGSLFAGAAITTLLALLWSQRCADLVHPSCRLYAHFVLTTAVRAFSYSWSGIAKACAVMSQVLGIMPYTQMQLSVHAEMPY